MLRAIAMIEVTAVTASPVANTTLAQAKSSKENDTIRNLFSRAVRSLNANAQAIYTARRMSAGSLRRDTL